MRFRQLIEDVFMKHRVLVVGAARESTGGVTTVLNLCEKMPMWKNGNAIGWEPSFMVLMVGRLGMHLKRYLGLFLLYGSMT